MSAAEVHVLVPTDLSANKVTVARFFAALTNDNLREAQSLLSEPAEFWVLSHRRIVPGRDWLAGYQKLIRTQAPEGVVFTVSALTAEEDRVAALVECSARLEGDRHYDNLYHFLIQLSGGLITKLWEYGDTLHAEKTFPGLSVATDEARKRAVHAVETEGEVIYAEATGAGTPVVLCHGLGGNHAIWWRQIETFARRHRVITWDQRGFGNSTAATGDVSIDAAARDLLSILAELDLTDACLVGQSMGAFTALRASLTDCTRIGSLIISTSLVAAPRQHTEALGAAVGGKTGRDQHPVVSEEFSRFSPDLVVLYNLISSFGSKPTSAAMLEHMARAEFTDGELRGLAVPAAFLAAEFDEFCPPRVMAHARARFPTSPMRVLAGASHSAYYEQPELWNEAVLELAGEIALVR